VPAVAYATWDQIFTGNDSRILKAQYGSILIRDYAGSATNMSAYSPFDPLTGYLSTTLTTTDGWVDCGLIDESGIQFTPKVTTVDILAWQSRQVQRTDITQDSEDFAFTMLQEGPLADVLTYQLPLTAMQPLGAEGYGVQKLTAPSLRSRQIIALGVDRNNGADEYFAIMFPLVRMVKPDKYEFSDKNPLASMLNWSSYIDPYSGFAVKRLREGPQWRSSGGITAAPGTPVALAVTGTKATLTFAPPVSTNGPFTYSVASTTAGVTSAVTSGSVVVTSSSPTSVVLTVSGLTAATAYTFTVTALGDNGAVSVPSVASNSITAIT
jgi:hypothetical protein